MPTASLVTTLEIGSTVYRSTRAPSSTGTYERGEALPAAKTGTLTTRTDNNTGVLTMASGHGFTTSDLLDVYWANADGSRGYRYGLTITNVATNAVTIDVGAGDNLPLVDTAVTAMIPHEYDFAVEYANLKVLACRCDRPAVFVFLSDSPATITAKPVDGANDSFVWDSDDGSDNPFDTTDAASVRISHGGTDTFTPLATALIN